MGRIQAQAFPEDFDPDVQRRVIRALEFIWFTSLLAWVNGWAGIGETSDELASATHLLFGPIRLALDPGGGGGGALPTGLGWASPPASELARRA